MRNSFFNGAGWLGGTLLNFIAMPFIVRKMGLDVFGVYALITATMGYLSILDLGIGQAIVKFVSEYQSQRLYEKVIETINNAVTLLLIMGFLGGAIIVLFSGSFSSFFNVPSAVAGDTQRALVYTSIVFILTIVIAGLSSVINGLQRFDITSKLMLAYNSSLLVLTLIVLFMSGKLSHIMLMNIFLLLLFTGLFFNRIYRIVPRYFFSIKLNIASLRPMTRFGSFLILSRISSLVFTQFDKLFIGAILGTTAVGYYAVPSRVLNSLLAGVASMGFAIMPRASEISSPDNHEKQKDLYLRTSYYLILFITPVFLVLILLSKRFMTFWMGSEFAEHSWLLMSIIALSYYLSASTNALWNVAIGMGLSKLQAVFSVILTIVSLAALYPMTVKWGIQGTAVAVLSGSIVVPMTFYYMNKKVFHVQQWLFVKKVLLIPFISSAIATTVIVMIDHWFPMTFLSFVALGTVIIVIYAISCRIAYKFAAINK